MTPTASRLLGAGLIGTFYAATLHAHRRRDRIQTVCAATAAGAKAFARMGDPAVDVRHGQGGA